MGTAVNIGIILILSGLVYIFLRRSQNSEGETNIEISNFKLKGGPGPILIVLGVLLIALEISLPSETPPKGGSPEVTPAEVTPATPSAEIEGVWAEYGVWQEDSFGMRIHTKFHTYNLKDEDCWLIAYFYYASGKALNDYNQNYSTVDGSVATYSKFTPGYVNAIYDDLSIFLPYDELHLSQGSYNLTFDLAILHEDKIVTESDLIYFDYTQPQR